MALHFLLSNSYRRPAIRYQLYLSMGLWHPATARLPADGVFLAIEPTPHRTALAAFNTES